MHVVVANQKGGAGKSSLIRSLAVATHQAGHATALLDTDPQGSLTSWWTGARIRSRCSCGSSWPISRPGSNGWPRRASSFCSWTHRPRFAPSCGRSSVTPASQSFRSAPPDDLDAVGDTLALIEDAGRPFLFVLTQAKPRTRLQLQAVMALAQHGKLAPAVIHDRTDFPTAAITGRAVTEIEPETIAAREVKDVLDYVLTQLRKSLGKAQAE